MNKTKKIILQKIKNGQVKMKPKWWFEMADKSMRGVWVMALLLSAIAITMIGIFVREYQPLSLLELGEVGKQLLIEDFPYWWLMGGGLFLILAVVIIGNIGNNYRRKKNEMWLMTLGIVLLLSLILVLVW